MLVVVAADGVVNPGRGQVRTLGRIRHTRLSNPIVDVQACLGRVGTAAPQRTPHRAVDGRLPRAALHAATRRRVVMVLVILRLGGVTGRE